jgi:predicted GNAT family acetyltransferase
MTIAGERALDLVVWHSLGGAHAGLARASSMARRYLPDVAPFADVLEPSPESLQALAALIEPGEAAVIMRTPALPHEVPAVEMTSMGMLRQMVARSPPPSTDRAGIVLLTRDDVPEIRALTALTNPGPFEARTFELGKFYGTRVDGKLIAMAGERMKPLGFTEISAVCTHPDHRGQGHARRLVRLLEAEIFARGETPFLHVLESNVSAGRLYLDMGFEVRHTTEVLVLQRPAPVA